MQGHQEYIQKKVNPVLEAMVTQVLLERPADLVPFMIKWLSDQSGGAKSTGVDGGEKTYSNRDDEYRELKKELEFWQSKLSELKEAVGRDDADAATKAAKDSAKTMEAEEADEEEEEEEEDDDEDVEDLPPPSAMAYTQKGPRTSVSAEAYGMWNKMKSDWTAPEYPKTPEQTERITKVLEQCFLFSGLDKKEMDVVVLAMQEKKVPKDLTLITQGEEGNELYVIEEGTLECFKKEGGGEKLVKVCERGDAFGELALMYNAPRAATVKSAATCVLWRLDRETFSNIVLRATRAKRDRWNAFLGSITLLERLDSYERDRMCDALKIKKVKAGEAILNQGDPGDEFFILEEGECIVKKVFEPGTPAKEVLQYSRGDYFGELALLHNEPRAATVLAKTDVELLVLDRRSFKLVLGPLEDILRRNSARYM